MITFETAQVIFIIVGTGGWIYSIIKAGSLIGPEINGSRFIEYLRQNPFKTALPILSFSLLTSTLAKSWTWFLILFVAAVTILIILQIFVTKYYPDEEEEE